MFASNAIKSVSRTNDGLTGRRISSERAGPSAETWGSTLIASSPASLAALLDGLSFGRLLRPRRQRRLATEHQQELTAIDACQRLAGNPRKHLTGIAIDVDHLRDREPRRIRAVDSGRHETIAHLDVRRRRREAKLG